MVQLETEQREFQWLDLGTIPLAPFHPAPSINCLVSPFATCRAAIKIAKQMGPFFAVIFGAGGGIQAARALPSYVPVRGGSKWD